MRRSLWLTACLVALVASRAHGQRPADPFVTLRGVVIDSSLRPLPGVLVYLSPARIFSRTDDDGEFTVAKVEPGVDTLKVLGRGFVPRAFRLFVPDSAQGVIDLGDFRLDPGPPPRLTLNATLRDTLADRPVVGAQVTVNDRLVGETDATGMFRATEIPIGLGSQCDRGHARRVRTAISQLLGGGAP